MVFRQCTYCGEQKEIVWIEDETADGIRKKACNDCFNNEKLGQTGKVKSVIEPEKEPEPTKK